MKISNEFKIGFWAIVALATLFLGVNWLKGLPMFKKGQNYQLVCDKVDGLAVSSHVKLHGMKVGTVLSMEYDAQQDQVNVLFSLYDKDMRLPVDSRLSVVSELLGTSDIIIEMGQSKEYYSPGAVIMAPPTSASLLDKADPIVTQIDQLLPKLDTLIGGINVLVNESKLHESMLEINTLTSHLNLTVNELNRLLRKDVPVVMDNLKDITSNVDTLTTDLREANIRQLLDNANTTLAEANGMIQKLQDQNSTVGKLLNTTELHDQLTRTVNDVDSLVSDIKKNPKRYIHIKVF